MTLALSEQDIANLEHLIAAAARKVVLYDSAGVALVTASGLYVQGNVAHDDADAGNPFKMGAKATNNISALTNVGNNDRANLIASLKGTLLVSPFANQVGASGDAISNANIAAFVDEAGSERSTRIITFLSGYDPDDGHWDRLRTLDNAAPGLGVLAVGSRSPGASEVKSDLHDVVSGRVTVKAPTSGKKIRIIALTISMSEATATRFSVYFGTGAEPTTDETKLICRIQMPATIGDKVRLEWPEGGGPVGAVDDVVSANLSTNVTSACRLDYHYREE